MIGFVSSNLSHLTSLWDPWLLRGETDRNIGGRKRRWAPLQNSSLPHWSHGFNNFRDLGSYRLYYIKGPASLTFGSLLTVQISPKAPQGPRSAYSFISYLGTSKQVSQHPISRRKAEKKEDSNIRGGTRQQLDITSSSRTTQHATEHSTLGGWVVIRVSVALTTVLHQEGGVVPGHTEDAIRLMQ